MEARGICPYKFANLTERKTSGLPILYHDIFKWKMSTAPDNITRFSDPSINLRERGDLVEWLRYKKPMSCSYEAELIDVSLLRNIDDKTSCQHLQILFSFSVPDNASIERITKLNRPIISAGAGNGYWEFLLQQNNVDVIAFDSNSIYPKSMHYINILEEGPSFIQKYPDRALMISWPDKDEESTFSLDCLDYYKGDIVIHIGELFGETCAPNPWGQTTTKKFQLALAWKFRCVYRAKLPNWPGHMDSISIWCQIKEPLLCDGAMVCFVPTLV